MTDDLYLRCDECGARVERKAIDQEPIVIAGVLRVVPPARPGANLPCGHDAGASWQAMP